jgi:N-methylhydantoinase A
MLSREAVPPDQQVFLREVDMRLCGQSFELKVPAPSGTLGPEHLSALEDEFHRLHERTYGHCSPGEPVEFVNLRLTARGIIPKPRMKRLRSMDGPGAPAERPLKGHRDVCFHAAAGYVSTPIYDRSKLAEEARISGPAVLEEFDSTTLIHPGYQGVVDQFGSVHIVRYQDAGGSPSGSAETAGEEGR